MADGMSGTSVFHVGALIDGTGHKPIKDAVVVIEGERVTQVGPRASISYDAENSKVVEFPESTAIPGLIDSHSHIFLKGDRTYLQSHLVFKNARAIKNAAELLRMGITPVQDLGAHLGNPDIYFWEAVKAGLIASLRISTSGEPPRMTGGMVGPLAFGIEVDGSDETRRSARQQLNVEADLWKVFGS